MSCKSCNSGDGKPGGCRMNGLAIKVAVTNLRYTTGWQILSFQMDKSLTVLLKLDLKTLEKIFIEILLISSFR